MSTHSSRGFIHNTSILWYNATRACPLWATYRITTTHVSTYQHLPPTSLTSYSTSSRMCPNQPSKYSNETDPEVTLEASHHLPPTYHT